MKNFFGKSWALITAHKVISGFIVLVVLGGGYFIYKKTLAPAAPTQYVLGQVEMGTLISSVEGTGQVSAKNQLDVLPQGSGKITSVSVKQGDTVAEGQTIAVIDERNANISLQQARANLESAEASYDKLINGATSANVNQSQLSVQAADQSLTNSIQNAYTQTDNLIKTDLDNFFSGPNSSSPQFQISFFDSANNTTVVLTPKDTNQTLNINAERHEVGSTLNTWQADISATSSIDLDTQASHAIQYLNQVKTFVNDIADAVNSLYLSQTKYQSNLNSTKSDIGSARSSVDSMISNIQNGQQSLANAKGSLAITTAPPRAEDVTSAKVQVQNAQTSLQSAQNAYDNNIIKAPFAGEVAALNVHVGDIAGGSTAVATITTPQKLAEISLNEVDVAKIALGEKATLTFDALPDLTITGTVAEIDTIGTVTQGVVDYTVKIGFDTQDERVLPGMSVSASIITSSKEGVLTVPSSAVKADATGNSYVQELPNAPKNAGTVSSKTPPVNVYVQVGSSNDTDIEITSGINEGDYIVTRTVSSSAAASTASAGGSLFGGSRAGATGAGAARAIPR